MDIWVVLPAFNEGENLKFILESVENGDPFMHGASMRAVVVDDGSTDNTAEVARRFEDRITLDLLINEENQGLASTFKRGMIYAVEHAKTEDVIVCMDADNSHLIGQVHALVSQIRQGRDVVIASRYQPGSVIRGVPVVRQWMSTGMSMLFRVVYPVRRVRDYSSGFRAYGAEFMKSCLKQKGEDLFSQDGFACMVALLLRMHKLGAIFGEIPMVLRYDQKEGETKMEVVGTVLKTIKVLMKERFSG